MARGVIVTGIDTMIVEKLFKEFKRKRNNINEETAFNETIKEFAIYILNYACVQHKLTSREE